MLTPTTEPKHYPGCCLTLSHRLFVRLTDVVREDIKHSRGELLLLSVGCGTGLFEAALAAHLQQQNLSQTRVEGIEVASADTKHLSSELVHRVRGTRDICRRAEVADILMFVYPRESELIKQYCTHFGKNIRTVLWLGPRADWVTQQDLLHNLDGFDGPLLLKNVGLASYEVAIAYRNNTSTCEKQHCLNMASEEASGIDVDAI